MDNLNESFLEAGFGFELETDEQLYLVVDGAQIEGLASKLYALDGPLHIEPIYMKPPYDQLIEVSPYIVQASKSVRDWFFELNNSLAGYFIASSHSLERICENYRNLIIADSPYGSKVYVKMAHSECAWVFYSTYTPQFWNDISKVWIPTRKEWKAAQTPDIGSNDKNLKISDEQWALLGKISWNTTVEKLTLHVFKWFPTLLENRAESISWVEQHALTAYEKGFTSERDLLMYINVIGFLGEDKFLDQKVYPDIYQLIEMPSQKTPSQRIEAASELAQAYSNHNITQEKQV
ncbi:DUF4123 domain-containing protein [Vibrio europaeus]|uniref:DUF4123 domain-containing protein n=1 Tax=Vibrio europaeus TaxID=300876 RepID=UPI00233E68D1|nr:DUF4123 domain-containing protein [Vibrio europaeus]MDC5821584.1 DUF4123 domain-containing protein [Vibrio europaeus]MDC5840456.1 DUF4123 domain-containing protein [Vibrio europaeus]MDC5868582.1 DUF4123 domain-containing protein [Vibrio europaeus]